MKYRLKSNPDTVVTVTTFEEFVEHGKKVAAPHLQNGVPWSFVWDGRHVTHMTDDHYEITGREPLPLPIPFKRGQLLTTDGRGFINIYENPDEFHRDYEPVCEVAPAPAPGEAVKEELIRTIKRYRKAFDEPLQMAKALRDELTTPGILLPDTFAEPREVVPNLVLSIRHVEDAIMRLGMTLKAIGSPNPYPQSYNPDSPVVEKTADDLKL